MHVKREGSLPLPDGIGFVHPLCSVIHRHAKIYPAHPEAKAWPGISLVSMLFLYQKHNGSSISAGEIHP